MTVAGYAWEFGNQFASWTMPGQADDVWQITEELNNNSEVSDNLGFTIDDSDYQTELAQLAAVSAEYSTGFYTCEDLDAYLAERAAKLEAAGLQTLVDGVQAQLDAFRAANGKEYTFLHISPFWEEGQQIGGLLSLFLCKSKV